MELKSDLKAELKAVFNLYQQKSKILITDLPKVLFALSATDDVEAVKDKINRALINEGKEEVTSLDFDEFTSIISVFIQYRPLDRDEEIFLLFDRDGNGSLSYDIIKQINKELNGGLTDANLRNIVRCCSSTEKQEITKDDFINALSAQRRQERENYDIFPPRHDEDEKEN